MGDGDGYQPFAGLLIDQGGNLYGTTTEYLRRERLPDEASQRRMDPGTLYQFVDFGQTIPQSRVVKGPGGALYGTTYTGGNSEDCWEFGCGTVYALRPPQTVCRTVSCSWSASYVEFDGTNGFFPGYGAPSFDAAGNMYVTTTEGGAYFHGNVAQLTRSGGEWTITSIHDFDGTDGYSPYSGVTIDAQGNLYGTTWYGGGQQGAGTVYRLTPSGSGWTFETLYTFQGGLDGKNPAGGLVLDQAGNLYGSTEQGGSGTGGTIFELSPSGSGWNFTVLYSFSGTGSTYGPVDTLAMDAAGNLYGTTASDGAHSQGSVFKLTRNNGNWTFTDLYDFTGGPDGGNPIGGVTLDPSGKMYGTTSAGGVQSSHCSSENYPGCGVVWEITP